jgi:L-alanine-DL-glutamate epimerase-like enolase superfamily enzyme
MTRASSTLTRRTFLGCACAAAAAPLALATAARGKESAVKIDRIETFAFRYPMTGYFKFFAGPQGSTGRAAIIIKMTASDGTVGWGQSVPIARWSYETPETAAVAIRRYFAPALIGRDPTDIAGAHEAMDAAVAPGFSTGMPISRAGLDVALHDLAGRLAGKSLAQMWDLPRGGPLTLSWTVNALTPDEVGPLIQAGRERGYKHFNIKVGPNPDFDAQLAREVRRLAPDTFLWADANGGYAPPAALEAAPLLADAGVDVLEAPLRPNQIGGYQALKRQGALPILMDEGIVSPVELEEFINLGMLDGVAMKHARCGGLHSARQQIHMLEARGLTWLGSGLTDPDISLAACLALYGAYGLTTPAALNGPQFLTADVLKKPLVIKDGLAEVPEGPGLGIEVDEATVRELVEQSRPARKSES